MTSARAPFPGADGLRHGALQTSGLPARVLAVLRASGFATLGDLCQPLPAAEKLDADDRALLSRVAAFACAWVMPTRLSGTATVSGSEFDP